LSINDLNEKNSCPVFQPPTQDQLLSMLSQLKKTKINDKPLKKQVVVESNSIKLVDPQLSPGLHSINLCSPELPSIDPLNDKSQPNEILNLTSIENNEIINNSVNEKHNEIINENNNKSINTGTDNKTDDIDDDNHIKETNLNVETKVQIDVYQSKTNDNHILELSNKIKKSIQEYVDCIEKEEELYKKECDHVSQLMKNIENILKERKAERDTNHHNDIKKVNATNNKLTIITKPPLSAPEKFRTENNPDINKQKTESVVNFASIASEDDSDDDFDPFSIVVPDQKTNNKSAKR